MINLISIDLDGTLLNDRIEISSDDLQSVQLLKERKVIVCICTGRSFVGIPDFIKKLKIADYYITSNGTSIYNNAFQKIYSNDIPYELAANIIRDLGALPDGDNTVVELLINGNWYISSKGKRRINEFIADKKVLKYLIDSRVEVDDLPSFIIKEKKNVEKINVNYCSKNFFNAFKEFIPTNKLRVWTDKPHKIDVYFNKATKGNALMFLCKAQNILLENVASIGNDENDIEMFNVSGTSIAMGNSHERIKDICKKTTLSNNDSGVSYAITTFLLSGV